jgi:hypothetical protein
MNVASGASRVLVPPVIAVVAGCGISAQVVATVGDNQVEVAAVQTYLGAAAGMDWQVVEERVASRLLDQFLDQEVVAAAAAMRREVEIPVDPGARSAAVRALLAEVCGPPPALPQEDLDVEVERRLQEIRPTRAHVRQLLLDTKAEAELARKRLVQGESFLEVSREVSRAPNAGAGGELGMVVQGTLPEDLDRVIFELGEGQISPPVSSPAGYHVFQVLEVVSEGPADRFEVEATVRREFGERSARGFTRDCVDRLAGEVGVELHEEHLWFRYKGRYGGDHDS